MGIFTRIPENTFTELQLDAGMLLKTFDPANPAAPNEADIISATTGGINPTCVPTYSDFFEDVDNAPTNTMEGKHLDGWDCKIATTVLGVNAETIHLSLGAADITDQSTYELTSDTALVTGKTYYTRSGTSPNYTYTAVASPSASSLSSYYEKTEAAKITPRRRVQTSDYQDLWWVGDRADGGMVAIKLINALSTGGFSLQTTKNGKGQLGIELTGHVSISDQDTVPMEFYVSQSTTDTDQTDNQTTP